MNKQVIAEKLAEKVIRATKVGWMFVEHDQPTTNGIALFNRMDDNFGIQGHNLLVKLLLEFAKQVEEENT